MFLTTATPYKHVTKNVMAQKVLKITQILTLHIEVLWIFKNWLFQIFENHPNAQGRGEVVSEVELLPMLKWKPLVRTIAVTDYNVTTNLQGLDYKIKSMMEASWKTIFSGNKNWTFFVCKGCGKEGLWNSLRDHIEAHHITGVSHTCNICGKIPRSRQALAVHKSRGHK